MSQENQFRRLLPVVQMISAVLFGWLGLWQRNQILSHSWLGWNSTGRFHVWPWPYKFAVVSNIPAFLAGSILSLPIGILWPNLPELIQHAPSLLFVPILWYWVGSKLDRRLVAKEGGSASRRGSPLVLLLLFTLICAMGAFLPIGYVGFIPYGIMVWVATGFMMLRLS